MTTNLLNQKLGLKNNSKPLKIKMVSKTKFKTIDNLDKPIIRSVLGHKDKIFAATAARVYYAEKGQKHWTRLKETAALIFYQCSQSGILYFCLIDLKMNLITWKQEIYINFKYFQDTEFFHSFEGDRGSFGLLFVNSNEAQIFFEIVTEKLESIVGSKSSEKHEKKAEAKIKKSRSIFGIFGFGNKSNSSSEVEESNSTEEIETESEKEKETKQVSIKPKEKKKSVKDKNAPLGHDDVSEPRDFTHLSHIGFNPETGTFDIQNIPADWKTLFAKAGITQDQLENRSTAKFIAGFVQDSDMILDKRKPTSPLKKKSAPPPPPPAPIKMKKSAPPPPPISPVKSKSFSAAPPPPPPKKNAQKASVIKPNLVSEPIIQPPPPPPPPPPQNSSSINPQAPANSMHSALLDSIRGAGLGILKPVKQDEVLFGKSKHANEADPHNALMTSIKNGANLKPAPKSAPRSPTNSPASTNSDPTDMMAAMLAKALAARNKKLSAESSDEDENDDSDDSRW